jgi:hypothetical protein
VLVSYHKMRIPLFRNRPDFVSPDYSDVHFWHFVDFFSGGALVNPSESIANALPVQACSPGSTGKPVYSPTGATLATAVSGMLGGFESWVGKWVGER